MGRFYECYVPLLMLYYYVKAESKEEAEEKIERETAFLVVCEETDFIPPNIKVIE